MQNLVKIGLSTVEMLRIYDLQDGGRLPPWIFSIVSKCKLGPKSTSTCKFSSTSDYPRPRYCTFSEETSPCAVFWPTLYTHCVSKIVHPFYFLNLNNSVKNEPISIIFGKQHPEGT